MQLYPKEGEVWRYGTSSYYTIGDVNKTNIVLLYNDKQNNTTYPLLSFTSRNWTKVEDAPDNLPEKWALKITKENSNDIYNFIHKSCKSFDGYLASWDPRNRGESFYFHFPQHSPKCYACSDIDKKYTEITFEQFEKHVLKKQIKTIKTFPEEGCCQTLDKDLVNYLNIRPYQDRDRKGQILRSSEGISWNNTGWYYVNHISNCTRKEYKLEELEHFFKKEIKQESLNKLETIKKKENYEHTKNNKSIKICRANLQISQGFRKGGIGIKGSGIKISIGNRHCYN